PGGAVGRERAKGANERLLYSVLRLGAVPKNPKREPEQPELIARHQLVKRGRIARSTPQRQAVLGIGRGAGPRQFDCHLSTSRPSQDGGRRRSGILRSPAYACPTKRASRMFPPTPARGTDAVTKETRALASRLHHYTGNAGRTEEGAGSPTSLPSSPRIPLLE